MSSLKSRLVLKCWSWYNEHKTRFTASKILRNLKLILTVLVVVAGSLLTLCFCPCGRSMTLRGSFLCSRLC